MNILTNEQQMIDLSTTLKDGTPIAFKTQLVENNNFIDHGDVILKYGERIHRMSTHQLKHSHNKHQSVLGHLLEALDILIGQREAHDTLTTQLATLGIHPSHTKTPRSSDTSASALPVNRFEKRMYSEQQMDNDTEARELITAHIKEIEASLPADTVPYQLGKQGTPDWVLLKGFEKTVDDLQDTAKFIMIQLPERGNNCECLVMLFVSHTGKVTAKMRLAGTTMFLPSVVVSNAVHGQLTMEDVAPLVHLMLQTYSQTWEIRDGLIDSVKHLCQITL